MGSGKKRGVSPQTAAMREFQRLRTRMIVVDPKFDFMPAPGHLQRALRQEHVNDMFDKAFDMGTRPDKGRVIFVAQNAKYTDECVAAIPKEGKIAMETLVQDGVQIFCIGGQHCVACNKKLAEQGNHAPFMEDVTYELIFADDSQHATKYLSLIGIFHNAQNLMFLEIKFADLVIQMRELAEQFALANGSERYEEGCLQTDQIQAIKDIALAAQYKPNQAQAMWAMAKVSAAVWPHMLPILEGKSKPMKIKSGTRGKGKCKETKAIVNSQTHWTEIATISEESLILLLKAILAGKLSLADFLTATRNAKFNRKSMALIGIVLCNKGVIEVEGSSNASSKKRKRPASPEEVWQKVTEKYPGLFDHDFIQWTTNTITRHMKSTSEIPRALLDAVTQKLRESTSGKQVRFNSCRFVHLANVTA